MGNNVGLRIVAKRGESSFLVMEKGDPHIVMGFVADIQMRERYSLFPVQSILARGYWEDQDHDADLLKELLSFQEV